MKSNIHENVSTEPSLLEMLQEGMLFIWRREKGISTNSWLDDSKRELRISSTDDTTFAPSHETIDTSEDDTSNFQTLFLIKFVDFQVQAQDNIHKVSIYVNKCILLSCIN